MREGEDADVVEIPSAGRMREGDDPPMSSKDDQPG
jgi:hypothetical protein